MKINCNLKQGAIIPTRNFNSDAGLDLYIKGYNILIDEEVDGAFERKEHEITNWFEEMHPEDQFVILGPNETIIARTGLSIEMPRQKKEINDFQFALEAQIRPRSGLAMKKGLLVVNTPGTIDQNYIGEIKVIIMNTSKRSIKIKNNDRIAQMIFNLVLIPEEFVEIKGSFASETSSDNTNRGSKGFGSSDKK